QIALMTLLAGSEAPVTIATVPNLVLGEQSQVNLEIRYRGKRDPAAPVRARASLGTIVDLTEAGRGMFGVYRPPATLYPQAAILGAALRINGASAVAWQILPLFGQGDLPV